MGTYNPAPDVRNYTLGKGVLQFEQQDPDTGVPLVAMRPMGNTPSFDFTMTIEKLEHRSSMVGISTMDAEATKYRKLSGKFVLDEMDKENMRLWLYGELGPFGITPNTSGELIGQLDFVSTNDFGTKYHAQIWKAKINPTGDLSLIGEDWAKMNFEWAALNDSENHPASPYGVITPIGQS